MEWETVGENTFKILKMNSSELVLKDVDLKVIYYYTNLKPTKYEKHKNLIHFYIIAF